MGARDDSDEKIYAVANRTRTVFYTPHVPTTSKILDQELSGIIIQTERCVEEHVAEAARSSLVTGTT